MRVIPVSCLQDNYAYLYICDQTRQAVVIDPGEAGPVIAALAAHDVEIAAIWNTHHHHDHIGGNAELLRQYPNVDVVAHKTDRGRIPGQTRFVGEGDHIVVGEECKADVLHNPGHTSGAVSYFGSEVGIVFTGDTLFGGGCGRLFEGTPEQMVDSLTRLCALPGETRVYCGHEYTAANLEFAAVVEPGNINIAARTAEVQKLREAGQNSMGFRISDEVATNVFVRYCERSVIAAAKSVEEIGSATPVAVFSAIRRWKDRF